MPTKEIGQLKNTCKKIQADTQAPSERDTENPTFFAFWISNV